MRRRLAFGRPCNEKARVPAFGARQRRDPAAEVDHLVDREGQPEMTAELAHRALAPMQQAAPRPDRRAGVGIERHQRTVGAMREQQAGLLEAFTNGRHVVVEPPFGQAQPCAGREVVDAVAARVPFAVARIEHTAGKHPGAAAVVAALCTSQQQDLDALVAIADHDEGGGGTGHGVGARQCGRWRRLQGWGRAHRRHPSGKVQRAKRGCISTGPARARSSQRMKPRIPATPISARR